MNPVSREVGVSAIRLFQQIDRCHVPVCQLPAVGAAVRRRALIRNGWYSFPDDAAADA